ncbi:MAG TPA: hypothetical protein VJ963_08755 [Bacteroidales bacterium]|nr:hypothetical protein [Bacteroidales bacterium]
MSKKTLNLLLLAVCFMLVISCSKDDSSVLGGAQSPIGTVGNTFDWNAGQFGINDASMRVTQLDGGVSTFECSGTTSNSSYVDLLNMVPSERFPGTFTVSGNTVTAKVNAVVTDNGVQVIFNDGSRLTLVNYGANVGDKYTATVGGTTLQNEVISKSTEDDYLWMGGMYLKVIEVKYTSHSPGINYVVAIYNHKFGLVGLEVHFEDGSVKYAGCESANSQ